MSQELPAKRPSVEQKISNVSIKGDNITVTFKQNSRIVNTSVNETREREFIATSPYKGLKKFELKDKDLFFGRDQFLAELASELKQTNLILLLGASGSGKSSVVQAGLIPWLVQKQGSRLISLIFTPDVDPFESLYASLLSQSFQQTEAQIARQAKADTLTKVVKKLKEPESYWFLYIDSFEKLFTTTMVDKRDQFIASLLQLSKVKDPSVKIMATMRADFLDRLDSYPALVKATNKHRPIIAEMQLDELRLAIEQPAAHHGVNFETGLVEEIIKDVQGQAGYLPLLQYTLNLLWETEAKTGSIQNRTLNVSTYRKLGGIRGALQKHIDDFYGALNEQEQLATQRVFLKLVDIGGDEDSGTEWKPIQRRALRSEFSNELEQKMLLELINKNLLVSNRQPKSQESTVEIAHETLLTSWTTLNTWIKRNRRAIALRNRLNDDVVRWQTRKMNDELWAGSKLQIVLELQQDDTFNQVLGGFSEVAYQFIQASVKLRERQRRRIIMGLVGVLIGALTLTGAAVWQWRNAERQATIAILRQKVAEIKNLLPFSQRVNALVLAIQATGESLSKLNKVLPDVESSLHFAIAVRERNIFSGHQRLIFSVAFSPDGKYIVSGSVDKTIRLWDVEGNQVGQPFEGHQDRIDAVAFSPDGKYVISGSDDKTIRLWDLEGNQIGQPFIGHQDEVDSVAFSPDGKYIISGSDDKTIRLWDLKGNQIGQPFIGHQDAIRSVAFSPDGKYIISGSDDKTIRLWDLKGNQIGQPFIGHQSSLISVIFSPDGKYIVSSSVDKTIRLWNLEGNQIGQPFIGHQAPILSIAFTSDGQYILSASMDKTVRLWDLEGNQIDEPFQWYVYENQIDEPLKGRQDSILVSAAISHNANNIVGNYIIGHSGDNILKLWDLKGNQIGQPFIHYQDAVSLVAFSSDGKYIISGGADKTIRLWDLEGNQIGQPFEGHQSSVISVAFSPDGKYIISGGADKTIRLWDLEGNQIGQPFEGHQSPIISVAFSPDGKYIVSGSFDKTIRLWDLEGNQIGQPFEGHQSNAVSVAFSPDGKYIVSGSFDKTIRLWDLEGNQIGQPFMGHQDAVISVAFSPNGQYIITGSGDKTIRLWDLEGNQIGQPFIGHQDAIRSVAFSPNGQYILSSGGKDKTIRLWGYGWKYVLEVGCNRLRYHPVLKNPQDDIASDAKKTCEKYVWNKAH